MAGHPAGGLISWHHPLDAFGMVNKMLVYFGFPYIWVARGGGSACGWRVCVLLWCL